MRTKLLKLSLEVLNFKSIEMGFEWRNGGIWKSCIFINKQIVLQAKYYACCSFISWWRIVDTWQRSKVNVRLDIIVLLNISEEALLACWWHLIDIEQDKAKDGVKRILKDHECVHGVKYNCVTFCTFWIHGLISLLRYFTVSSIKNGTVNSLWGFTGGHG